MHPQINPKREMKKVLFTLLCAALTACTGGSQKEQNDSAMEQDKQLTAFDVQKEFTENGFSFFIKNMVVCSGGSTENNAMTIGSGSIGNFLGTDIPAVMVYVAPARYTHELMEKHPRFTIMKFDSIEIPRYLGTHSGRDGDKAKELGLHVAYTEHGTPYYEEASMVIECETMTSWKVDPERFRNGTSAKWYEGFTAGYHTAFVGQVIGAWRK